MNYEKHYERLISKGLNRSKPKEYVEEHHILPVCLGGSDNKNNLVYLTAREHFIAHALLARIHGGKTWSASYYMGNRNQKQNSKIHAKAREEHAKLQVYIGVKNYELGLGIASMSAEERTNASKKGAAVCLLNKSGIHKPGGYSTAGKTTFVNKVGMFSVSDELKKEWGSRGGNKAVLLKLGIHSEGGYSKGGTVTKAKGVGIFAQTKEERSKAGKNGGTKGSATTNLQRWKCFVCGFESTAAGVVSHCKGTGHSGKVKIR